MFLHSSFPARIVTWNPDSLAVNVLSVLNFAYKLFPVVNFAGYEHPVQQKAESIEVSLLDEPVIVKDVSEDSSSLSKIFKDFFLR